MVLAEAMARGLPIVCTTGGAAAETVPDAPALKVAAGRRGRAGDAAAPGCRRHALRRRWPTRPGRPGRRCRAGAIRAARSSPLSIEGGARDERFSPEWLASARAGRSPLAQRASLAPASPGISTAARPHHGRRSRLRHRLQPARHRAAAAGPTRSWTLVDYDPALLEPPASALAALGRRRRSGERVADRCKGAKRISVEFRRADLAADLDAALGPQRRSRHRGGAVRSRLGRIHRPLRRRGRGRRKPPSTPC